MTKSECADAEEDTFEEADGGLWLDLVRRGVDLTESLEDGRATRHDVGAVRRHIPVTTEL